MSEHKMKLTWVKETEDFDPRNYNRSHQWDFGHENIIDASSAPEFRGNPEMVDPEEAFVASLASCHMLTFLFLACKQGFVINRYDDEPVGILEKNREGAMAITTVTLHPKITFEEGKAPDQETLDQLHASAHIECFISNSVKTRINILS